MGSFDSVYAEIGRRIRQLRIDKRITQERLADLASLTRTSITNIEKGRQKLPIHTLYVLASALGVRPKELLPDDSEKKKVALGKKILKDLSKKEAKWVEAVMKGGVAHENPVESDPQDGSKPTS